MPFASQMEIKTNIFLNFKCPHVTFEQPPPSPRGQKSPRGLAELNIKHFFLNNAYFERYSYFSGWKTFHY